MSRGMKHLRRQNRDTHYRNGRIPTRRDSATLAHQIALKLGQRPHDLEEKSLAGNAPSVGVVHAQ
jgi:hypothetical protein